MSFIISIEELNDPNTVGEVLRDWSFREKTGCYNCFDLIYGFENVKINEWYLQKPFNLFKSQDSKYNQEIKKRMSLYYHKERDILVAWFWDGDGELYFNAGGVEVYNKDCKKDYTWEFVEEL